MQPEPNTRETILVVEDEPVVLKVVCGILNRAGFRVLATGSGAEAIQVESATPGTIHLLLSDVMMPDMSGPDIAKLLERHRPDMRVMLMSGYASAEMLFLNHGWRFIAKPFLPAKLVEKVNDTLHTPLQSQGEDRFSTPRNPRAAE